MLFQGQANTKLSWGSDVPINELVRPTSTGEEEQLEGEARCHPLPPEHVFQIPLRLLRNEFRGFMLVPSRHFKNTHYETVVYYGTISSYSGDSPN